MSFRFAKPAADFSAATILDPRFSTSIPQVGLDLVSSRVESVLQSSQMAAADDVVPENSTAATPLRSHTRCDPTLRSPIPTPDSHPGFPSPFRM